MSNQVHRYTFPEGLRPSSEKMDWQDGETDTAFARRHGYNDAPRRFGPETGWHLDWFERADNAPETSLAHRFPYYAQWTDGIHDDHTILVSDFASLLALKAFVAPIIQADQTTFFHETVMPLLERTFRVYHGHDPSGVCHHCDPDEVQSRKVEGERLAKANKKNG